jgi:hypothetical protein
MFPRFGAMSAASEMDWTDAAVAADEPKRLVSRGEEEQGIMKPDFFLYELCCVSVWPKPAFPGGFPLRCIMPSGGTQLDTRREGHDFDGHALL